MSDITVIETRGDYRVGIELEHYPVAPEDESAVPQFAMMPNRGYGAGWSVSGEVGDTASLPVTPEEISEAFSKFRRAEQDNNWGWKWDAERLTERWLRVFHGAAYAKVDQWQGYSQSDWGFIVAVATQEWADKWGMDMPAILADNSYNPTEELEHYLRGDVVTIVVERNHGYAEIDENGDVIEGTEFEDWETEDSCGGYYGDADTAYVRESALEMLESYAPTQTSTDS